MDIWNINLQFLQFFLSIFYSGLWRKTEVRKLKLRAHLYSPSLKSLRGKGRVTYLMRCKFDSNKWETHGMRQRKQFEGITCLLPYDWSNLWLILNTSTNRVFSLFVQFIHSTKASPLCTRFHLSPSKQKPLPSFIFLRVAPKFNKVSNLFHFIIFYGVWRTIFI